MAYKMCTRCVMDTTAEEITFDDKGVCSFCYYFDKNVKTILDRTQTIEGRRLLEKKISTIKFSGHGKLYDSILGMSGGLDSSYLAYLAAELGLVPLVVHVDTGWNSSESESNVKNLVEQLGFDLEIIKVDWEEMRRLQIGFYRASVRNCEIPQDHAFLAALYRKAAEKGVHYLLLGTNYASESILPKSWGYNTGDSRHILAIHRRFSTGPLRKFPLLSFWERYLLYPFIRRIRVIRLLNHVQYNRGEAKRILAGKYGWQDYGTKHCESVLTRFFQGYYLPTKFCIDKRKAHLSSLILSGQIARDEALMKLRKPPYLAEELIQADKAYIAKRLGLSLSEWQDILALPPRGHNEFPSSKFLFVVKDALLNIAKIRGRF